MGLIKELGIKKNCIIVVDDDLKVQEQIVAFFTQLNFEVICFTCPKIAINVCATSGTSWDVVLTNFHFSTMTGVEFTVAVRNFLPDLPIILLSPLETADVVIEAIQKGAYDFIVKPIHFTQLQISVERALQLKFLKLDLIKT